MGILALELSTNKGASPGSRTSVRRSFALSPTIENIPDCFSIICTIVCDDWAARSDRRRTWAGLVCRGADRDRDGGRRSRGFRCYADWYSINLRDRDGCAWLLRGR